MEPRHPPVAQPCSRAPVACLAICQCDAGLEQWAADVSAACLWLYFFWNAFGQQLANKITAHPGLAHLDLPVPPCCEQCSPNTFQWRDHSNTFQWCSPNTFQCGQYNANTRNSRQEVSFDCHQSTLVDIVHVCPIFKLSPNSKHFGNSQLTCRQSTPVPAKTPVIQKKEQVTDSHPHLWNTVFLPNCLDRQLLHKQTKLPQRHVHKRASNKCPSTSLKPSLFFQTC